jgi:hypothetical protein
MVIASTQINTSTVLAMHLLTTSHNKLQANQAKVILAKCDSHCISTKNLFKH